MTLIRVPGKGVIKGSAGVGLFRVPPVLVGPIVTGIILSPATGTANSASGTVVGTLTATTSTGVALTSPVWTLLTSAGGDFQIINGNQVAFLPGNVPTGSYSLSVQAASSNAPTFSQAVAVKISAASGGTGIPGPVPVAAGAAITSVQFRNLASSAVSNPAVSYVQGFARAAVPNAASAHLVIAGMTVQQDAETYYSDGSLKQAVITAQPASIAATTTTTAADISWASSAPTRTAGVTLAQIAANSDIRLQLSGFDLGADVFELSVNDIISGGTAFPWGTNPVQGWRLTRSGPVQTEWMFWCFIKRVGDGARHKWIKAKLWLSALSPTVYRIRAKVQQSNTFGPSAGTVGETVQGSHAFIAVLKNGATTVYSWGGANDTRITTLQGSAFSPATQVITTPGIFLPYQGTAISLAPAAGGTLPAGLQVGKAYFISWPDPGGGANSAGIFASRFGSVRGVQPRWVPGTVDANNEYSYIYRYNSIGELWSLRPEVGGPMVHGSYSVEPSGLGPFVDGPFTWTKCSAGFTAAGTGTINLLPFCVTYAFTGVELLDFTNGERVWVGAPAHSVVASPEISYYTRKANLTPPYDQRVAITASAGVYGGWPGSLYGFNLDLNAEGDNPGDERIAPLNHSAVRALLRPFDAGLRAGCIHLANGFTDYHTHMEDEGSGVIPTCNAGPARNGVAYPNLPLHTNSRAYPFSTSNVANPSSLAINNDAYIERYGAYLSGTHLPTPGYGAYLITGDDAYIDQISNQFSVHTLSQTLDGSPGANMVVGGVTYYYVGSVDPHQSGRNNAWGTNLIGNLNHILPPDNPARAYVTDIYNDNANATACYKEFPADKKFLGIYCSYYNTYYEQFWMDDFMFQMYSREALRGDNPAWYDVLSNHMQKYSLGRMDANGVVPGGCLYYASLRNVYVYASNNVFLQSFDDIYRKSVLGRPDYFPAGYAGCPTSGQVPDPTSGSSPPAPTSIAQFALNTTIYASLIGLPHATDLMAAMKASIIQFNGGQDNLANLANYPEFSWGYYP